MNIDDFAKHILLSPNLQDKLFFPEEIKYNNYESLSDVIVPARNKDIIFDHPFKLKPEFKKIKNLETEFARASVFHFFANHELLALELMALAILKFPDTAKAYKSSLIVAMRDEQKHLQFYLQQMQEYGMQFGDLQLNAFFWNSLSPVKTAKEFCAGLSLCLEQANLDFSLDFQNKFKSIGDLKSANYLKEVYDDEISHVKMGLHWFKEWQDPSKTLWQDWNDSMQLPLGPQRAKSFYFSKEARQLVGFDDNFIQQLDTFVASKGRAPDVFYFNAGSELEPQQIDHTFLQLRKDLSPLMQFLCKNEDILLIENKLSVEYLTLCKKLSFPRFEELNIKLEDLISYTENKKRKYYSLQAWGFEENVFAVSQNSIFYENNLKDLQELKNYSSKIFASEMNKNYIKMFPQDSYLQQEFSVKMNSNEAQEQLPILLQTYNKLILKAKFGSSGQNNLVIHLDSWQNNQSKIQKFLKENFEFVVEEFLDRVFDFSMQFEKSSKEIKFLSAQRFLTSPDGHFRGCVIRKFDFMFTPDELELYYKKDFKEYIQECGLRLQNFLQDNFSNFAYNGPICIDCFVYKKNNSYFLKPIVEINLRNSFGRLALKLTKYIDYKSYALLKVEKIKSLQKKFHCKTKSELIQFFEQQNLSLYENTKSQTRLIQEAFLALNDLRSSESFVAYLEVKKS